MKSLLIPMAGRSTRYPGTRPKFLLSHPKTGNLMCVESILGLNLDKFEKIYFTYLQEHEDLYNVTEALNRCLAKNFLLEKSEYLIIDGSESQSETVYKTIKAKHLTGGIIIKDSDGYFKVEIDSDENQVIYLSLNEVGEIVPVSKSYIQRNKDGYVTKIEEKKVISENFCCGYGFKSAAEFCRYYEQAFDYTNECYISDVIHKMLDCDEKFVSKKATEFIDWGTASDWKKYCDEFATLFVDLDGTLITNTHEFIPPYIGTGLPIKENIESLQKKKKSGKCTVIITTARNEDLREMTKDEIRKHDIPCDQLIMGLPHSRRYLINDYANTNSYPTALAINIERNSNNLGKLI